MSTRLADGFAYIDEGNSLNTEIKNDGSIELSRTGSAVPYIDFKMDSGVNFDARIRKQNDAGVEADNGLWFQVGGDGNINTGMILNSDGVMRLNSLPVFDVASTAGGLGFVNINTSYLNNGSHFNFSTDRFTAPIDGTYLFYATSIKQTSTTASVTRVQVYINGSTSQGGRQVRLSEGGDYGSNGVGFWMVPMSKGDYAQYYVTTYGSHASTNYTYFGGKLLY